MAASGSDLRHICCGLSGASVGRHYHGALWRFGRAQKNVHPQYSADGGPDAGDWLAADVCLDGHCCAGIAAIDAHFAGRGDWRRSAGRMGVCR
ncbi:hypothetical protein D3C71_1281330 [compost metagenome]